MQRRHFLMTCTAAACSPLPHAFAQTAPRINVLEAVKALRITSGPYAGGYEIAPNGRLNWYFTALGLLPLVQWLSPAELDTYIRSYLDLYLRSLTPTLTIEDVDFPRGRADHSTFTRVPSDSDDSYAATFLSLAARYLRASRNTAWWTSKKQLIKDLAYRNLPVTVKPNGLTSVFQPPRNSQNSIGYFMDNCEVYRGMRDFAEALRSTGDTVDADYYDAFAATVAGGLGRLFHTAAAGFRAGDAYRAPETGFYPGTTCQVFAQAFGVRELSHRFDAAWAYLNLHTPNWQDSRYDPYPWAILGFVAAQRGLNAAASAQMRMIEQKFVNQRALVTINELGFYQRTAHVLAGGVDV